MKKQSLKNLRIRFLIMVLTLFTVVSVCPSNAGNLSIKVFGAENASRKVKAGWNLIDGKWFYYNTNGSLKTGWLFDGGYWYFLNKDGSMATGWIKDGGKLYYLKDSGAMAANTKIDSFTFGADGAWINGFNMAETLKKDNRHSADEKNLLKSKINQIIQKVIKPNMSDMEKELALHDYVVLNTKYDYDNYYKDTIPYDSYTAYGALIKGTAVCEGYVEAMYLLLNSAGIETNIVYGTAKSDGQWGLHTWNMVKINGELYHVDATWDDPVPMDDNDSGNYVSHQYFNVADDELAKNHFWKRNEYPKCEGVKYNYNYYMYCLKNNISLDKEPLKIWGTISLPGDEKAPKGGFGVTIWAQSSTGKPDYSNDEFLKEAYVLIPEGNKSAIFSLNVPQIDSGYSVCYLLRDSPTGYMSSGFYSDKGIVDYKDRTLITTFSAADVKLTIQKGNVLSGTVFLPGGEVAPKGGLTVQVTLEKQSEGATGQGKGFFIAQLVTIPEGSNSMPYSITLLPTASNYSVRYSLHDNAGEYLDLGYYSEDGTVSSYNERTLIGSGSKSNVDLTILKGKRISGTIFLPKGEVAPKGGLEVYASAETVKGGSEEPTEYFFIPTKVLIPEGSNSTPYSLYVPLNKSGYIINYHISEETLAEKSLNYLSDGYYSSRGTVMKHYQGTIVFLDSASNINLTIRRSGNE